MTNRSAVAPSPKDTDFMGQREDANDATMDRSAIDRKASFARFVYPFAFDPTTFAARITTLASSKWHTEKREFLVWEDSCFPESDLLAHVRNYLNTGEASDAGVGPPIMPTARLMKLTYEALHSAGGLGSNAEWSISIRDRGIPFHWNGVSIVLFHSGIGLLVLDAAPQSELIDDWLDFIHYFRYTQRQDSVELAAKRQTGKDSCTAFFSAPAGGVGTHPDGQGLLQEIIAALLSTGHLPNDALPWWGEVFVPRQTISYVALFADGVSHNEQMRLVYRLRNCFHARQEIHPCTSDLAPDHPSLLPYAEGQ